MHDQFTEEIVINTSQIRYIADGALAIGAARLLLLPRDVSWKTQPHCHIRGVSWHLDNRLQLFSLRAATHPASYLPTQQRRSLGQVAIQPADKGGWSIVFFLFFYAHDGLLRKRKAAHAIAVDRCFAR